jgi:hypothetical protein
MDNYLILLKSDETSYLDKADESINSLFLFSVPNYLSSILRNFGHRTLNYTV